MLNVKRIDAAGVREDRKPYRLADEKGLYLQVTKKGHKYWRFRYRFGGKQKLLALGVYPAVTLRQARDSRDDARSLLRPGKDPAAERKAKKLSKVQAQSFEEVVREWIDTHRPSWSKSNATKVQRRLEREVFP